MMPRSVALTFMLIQCLGAPAMTAAAPRAVSFEAADETAPQVTRIPVSPRTLPDTNNSLSLVETSNSTPGVHFHIPDSPIDLFFTFLGRPLILWAVVDLVELALDRIAPNVDLRPTESITDGFFRQERSGLEIKVYQYTGREITWYLLERLLLGIIYYSSQQRRPVELRFEIYVMGQGRVRAGYGSLWDISRPNGNVDVAKRALIPNNPPQPLSIPSISNPTAPQTPSNRSSLIIIPPTLNASRIVFSYHLFGPPIPEPAITLCFSRARQRIRAHLHRDPYAPIPDDTFEYTLDHIPLLVSVTAYPGKHLSWQLLDRVLHDVSADIIGEHHLRGCEFEFEIEPFEEPHGHGSLAYSR